MDRYSIEDINADIIQKIRNNNEFGNCEGVITSDGLFYPCQTEHTVLVRDMNYCNIDYGNALRVSVEQYLNTTSLSSLEAFWVLFVLDDSLKKDKSIKLTEAQVRTFVKLYNTMKIGDKDKETFANILKRSVNLGWNLFDFLNKREGIEYYNTKVATHNIELFIEVIGKDNLNEYIKLANLLDDVKESNKKAIVGHGRHRGNRKDTPLM